MPAIATNFYVYQQTFIPSLDCIYFAVSDIISVVNLLYIPNNLSKRKNNPIKESLRLKR